MGPITFKRTTDNLKKKNEKEEKEKSQKIKWYHQVGEKKIITLSSEEKVRLHKLKSSKYIFKESIPDSLSLAYSS